MPIGTEYRWATEALGEWVVIPIVCPRCGQIDVATTRECLELLATAPPIPCPVCFGDSCSYVVVEHDRYLCVHEVPMLNAD